MKISRHFAASWLLCLIGFCANAEGDQTHVDGFFSLGLHTSYGVLNSFGESSVPTFRGYMLGPEIEYSFLFNNRFGFSLLGAFRVGQWQNTANSIDQREELSRKTYLVGARGYLGIVYFHVNYTLTDEDDAAIGAVTQSLSLRAHGFETGAGIALDVGRYIRILAGVDVAFARYAASEFLSGRRDAVSYAGALRLHVLLPSGRRDKISGSN